MSKIIWSSVELFEVILFMTQVGVNRSKKKKKKVLELLIQDELKYLLLNYWCSHNLTTREAFPCTLHAYLKHTCYIKIKLWQGAWGKLACDPVLICCFGQSLCCNNVLSLTDTGNLTTDAKAKKKCNTPTEHHETTVGKPVRDIFSGTKTFLLLPRRQRGCAA